MATGVLSALASWQNFYVIVGSSAGALTGLQFVVIALVAQTRVPGTMREIRAFSTPTIVKFCVALLVAALMTAPWRLLSLLGACLSASGIAGIVYSFTVLRHARKSSVYTPDTEDWFWYAALPVFAYSLLLTAGILALSNSRLFLFINAAATLLFLFLGIHNAWDTVTYIAVLHRQRTEQAEIADKS